MQFSSKAQLKQLFRIYPMMTQRHSERYSASLCQYDLICPDSSYDTAAHWSNWHVFMRSIRFVLLAIKLIAIRSYLSKQRCVKQQCSEVRYTCLYITIQFVLLLTTIFHYDRICLAADNKFSLRYDLSHWQSCFCNTI